jgi:hypothetical protein
MNQYFRNEVFSEDVDFARWCGAGVVPVGAAAW